MKGLEKQLSRLLFNKKTKEVGGPKKSGVAELIEQEVVLRLQAEKELDNDMWAEDILVSLTNSLHMSLFCDSFAWLI